MNEYLIYLIIRISIAFGIIIVLSLFIYITKQIIKSNHPPYYHYDNTEGKLIAKVYIWHNGSRNSKGRYICYEFEMINDEWTLTNTNTKTGIIFAIIIGLIIFVPFAKGIIEIGEYMVQLFIVLGIFTLLIMAAVIGDIYIDNIKARKIFMKMLEDPNQYMHY